MTVEIIAPVMIVATGDTEEEAQATVSGFIERHGWRDYDGHGVDVYLCEGRVDRSLA